MQSCLRSVTTYLVFMLYVSRKPELSESESVGEREGGCSRCHNNI